jgi:hypothetical protein
MISKVCSVTTIGIPGNWGSTASICIKKKDTRSGLRCETIDFSVGNRMVLKEYNILNG